jgi:hypothetical protein
LTGWWNSVAAGDFDGDGRLDLVAGNWGRNTPYQRFLDRPLQLHFGEPAAGAGLSLLEAHADPELNKWVPSRDWGTLRNSFPMLQDKFHNFTAFSKASLSEVLAGLPRLQQVSAATLDSMLLLNRGDHFEVKALPAEAQLSPVFGLGIGDLDGDGNEDLVLAQNFFGVGSFESRYDAGCGLWLRGDGRGDFEAMSPLRSGIAAYGEGRGVALCDFDQDGRLDVALGQNQGPTKLYRNRGARPGLRVHLQGADENPNAIGAALRVVFQDGKKGPVHEIRAGGGYWSQDSPDVVLGTPTPAKALIIRWPTGVSEEIELSPGARSITRKLPAK